MKKVQILGTWRKKLLALALVGTLALTACGGGNEASSTAASDSTAAASTEVASSAEESTAAESTETATTDKTFHVGIVQLVEHPALDQATEGFQEALKAKLGDKVTFDVQNAQGEQANAATIVQKFVANNVDLIMGNATNAVKAAVEATSDIPIVGTSVTDYVESGLVASDEAPGANVTGASDSNPVEMQVALLKQLVPTAKTVGIVYSSSEENSEIQAQQAKTAFEAEGITVNLYTVADSNEIQTVVTKAVGEVDAFYEPSDNLIASNVATMSNITTPAKKPVIAAEEGMVNAGFLGTYSISYLELGKKAGDMAAEILLDGKDPATMPIFHFTKDDLTLVINKENAAAVGVEIPADLQ